MDFWIIRLFNLVFADATELFVSQQRASQVWITRDQLLIGWWLCARPPRYDVTGHVVDRLARIENISVETSILNSQWCSGICWRSFPLTKLLLKPKYLQIDRVNYLHFRDFVIYCTDFCFAFLPGIFYLSFFLSMSWTINWYLRGRFESGLSIFKSKGRHPFLPLILV